ncbi:hypothetical protein [Pontimicrobium sp. IMCC45349]|uniref:hypothetical protein n=1 Tax=Pontimicrobium sp. IMCC45349 TaxID=3391574 RepID=UPI0039A05E1E
MGEIIQSLKEFVWDIIGYLIPGFALLIVFNFITPTNIAVEDNFLFDWNIFDSFLIIVISYLLGFVVYGITIFKIRNQDLIISEIEKRFENRIQENKKFKKRFNKYIGSKHSRFWQRKFKDSSTVKSARSFLTDNGYKDVNKMQLNEMRNILMSRNPEMDEKVYTFMFRSSVFDHLSTILMIVCIAALIQIILSLFGSEFFFIKTGGTYNFLYSLFVFIIPLLGNSKRIFYSISQRIPFSNLK